MQNYKAILLSLGLLYPGFAHAADTTETWEIGATDVDFYAGYTRGDRVFADMMLGYGLAERFSAYFGANLSGNRQLSSAGSGVYLGLFGTPLDTKRVDLDIFMSFGAEGSELILCPAAELNLDLEVWGIYLRAGAPIQAGPSELELNPGVYLSLGERQQILLEYYGGAETALGYNVMLSPALELVTEISTNLESPCLGFMAGLIATIPST